MPPFHSEKAVTIPVPTPSLSYLYLASHASSRRNLEDFTPFFLTSILTLSPNNACAVMSLHPGSPLSRLL